MSRSARFCGLLAALIGAGAGAPAYADDAADTAAARKLGGDGVTLADAGNCTEAVEKLRRAEDLHHAPTTAARLGECEIEIGRVVAGTERLQRLLREPLTADAPQPFIDALATARSTLDRARPRIATMRIEVKAPPASKVHVTVDGEPLSDALVGSDRPSDPGHHTIEASGPDLVTSTHDLTLGDGETATVSLLLVAVPPKPAPLLQEAQGERVSPAPTTSRASAGPGAASILALSVGGLGLAAGVAAGIATALDSSDLSKSCGPSRQCPSDKQSELTAAKTWATVSTVGFAVAGAGLGTGLVLLLVHKHEPERASEAKLHPVVGPLYLGCGGTF